MEKPIFIKSQLGWVFDGWIGQLESQIYNVITNNQFSKQLTQFSRLENISHNRKIANHLCESHFIKIVKQDSHYIVNIPFSKDVHVLGDPSDMAKKRLRSLEKKKIRKITQVMWTICGSILHWVITKIC